MEESDQDCRAFPALPRSRRFSSDPATKIMRETRVPIRGGRGTDVTAVPYEPGAVSQEAGLVAQKLQSLMRKIVHSGVGPLSGSIIHANDRLARARSEGRSEQEAREAAIDRIVAESIAKAGVTGFTTGFGGLVAMPITVPAGIGGNLMLNARMVGSIAHLRGYDLHDPRVETMMQLLVAGLKAEKVLKEFGVKVGKRVAERAVMRGAWMTVRAIPGYLVDGVGVRAGYLLVVRYGTTKGAALLYKSLPVIGGIVGGAVDGVFTKAIATAAKNTFV